MLRKRLFKECYSVLQVVFLQVRRANASKRLRHELVVGEHRATFFHSLFTCLDTLIKLPFLEIYGTQVVQVCNILV